MRVLFVISGLGMGGAERQVVLLSKEFRRRGHAVSIYALNREAARLAELHESGVDVVFDQKRARLDPTVLMRLRRHIRRWQPELIHGFLFDGNLYSRLAAVGTGIPAFASERSDDYSLSRLQRLSYRLTAPLCDGVVANSHAGASYAERWHCLPREQVHVVWNGIDLVEIDARLRQSHTVAQQIWPSDASKRGCIVGSIKPAKDYPLALRVMRALIDRDPGWRFICVGDELPDGARGERATIMAERERLGLSSYVQFVGRRNDVPELIASSDVLLITSSHEGFPNVVLEAMACGTPVASTDYSDICHILPRIWQVASARNPQALADIVERCFAERPVLSSAQRTWVEAHATAAAAASALLAVYAGSARSGTQPNGVAR